MRFAIAVLMLLLLSGCAAPKTDDYIRHIQSTSASQQWVSPLPVYLAAAQIELRGEYDSNNATEQLNVLYAGDAGIVGFMAQVAAHAALSNNAQNSRLSEQQLQANKVLEPLAEQLHQLHTVQLTYQTPELSWLAQADPKALYMVSKPIFFLSQDARVLSLKHIVQLEPAAAVVAGKKATALYSNLIEVVAEPLTAERSIEYWQADQGAALIGTMQAMYQQSMALALADVKGQLKQDTQAETFRLAIADKLRIERGNRISASCKQLVFRNLRGWILAMSAQSGHCEPFDVSVNADTTPAASHRDPEKT